MNKPVSVALLGFMALTLDCGAASDVTGRVNVVNVNRTWGGTMIQLENAPRFEIGSACEGPWAFVPATAGDDLAKQLVAVAMAAKASGETVRVGTSGCMTTAAGSIPRLEWIDFGTRVGA